MPADPIRALLAGVPQQPFWAPRGQVAILEDKVVEAGGDPAEVEAWVEAQGGRLDRTVPAARRSVFSMIPVEESVRYYILPAAALSDDAAA